MITITSTTNMTATSSSAPSPGISPSNLTKNQEVNVESRTWAGINKPGGHAIISKIHYDDPANPTIATKVDVKYVLGGSETNVELTYIKAHVELSRRSRSRRSDVKMNVETLGGAPKNNQRGNTKNKKSSSSPTKAKAKGGKKRKALADLNIDKNNGKAKKGAKKGKKKLIDEPSSSSPEKKTSPKKKKVDNNCSPSPKKKRRTDNVIEEVESSEEDDTLASIAKGGKSGNAKTAKKTTKKSKDGSSKKEAGTVEIAQDAAVEDGTWTLIKGGKMSDYTSILTKHRRISYWWSDEDGWLAGSISKALAKVVTSSTIRWTVKVDFDNGDVHTLTFHPLDGRWKYSEEICAPIADSPKKPEAKKFQVGKKSSTAKQSIKKKTALEKVGASAKVAGEEDKKPKAAKKPTPKSSAARSSSAKSATAKPNTAQTRTPGQKQPTLSFGSGLQSKIREISSKMHSAKVSPADHDDGLVMYSPRSTQAVKAAHLKSPTPASRSTASIGYSESFPSGSPVSKRSLPKDMEEKAARSSASQVSLFHEKVDKKPKAAMVASAKASAIVVSKSGSNSAKPIKASGKMVTMTSLYKKEAIKADKFVDFMTGPSEKMSGKVTQTPPSPESSAGSSDDGVLELKLDQQRVELFNTILSQIMFRPNLEEMDVETMITQSNQHHTSPKPFTLLEIKPYLQKLHDDCKIFFVEEEGKMGTCYAI